MWQNPARNIEIKARINDVKAIVNKVAQLCKTEAEVIDQTDTFFKTENGRLKLREFKNGTGELIYYERPDTDGPKLSNYSKSMVTDPTSLKAVLQMALDEVVGLGNFLELEVVLQDSQTPADGITTAQLLLEILGIPASDLLSGSYLDFLNLL
ncbi:uncharacterized protein LOC124338028 isoform X2 [Daphnia pulicaria]|uniref:uncharacterized protein LOC124338028 isoform X2 n=1 Tax=Daphnia pulicaria TaxID=35523 RepID=UPI001EEA7020|nr:uncharacterized protein LOC124338028 isoform X2 [Daphnia pulicaria]